MIRKRCGVDLGKEVLNQAKLIFGVQDFWKKITQINRVVRKVSYGRWEALKNRIVIVEIEAMEGLTSWLKYNGLKVLINPTNEEIKKNIVSTHPCFFIFTVEEYSKRQSSEEFQKIIKKLPKPVNLSMVDENSHLTSEEVLNAFSEVSELPECIKYGIEIKKTTLVNLVILLILLKNCEAFCCEATYCTEERVKKCREYLSKIQGLKREFFNLLRVEGIYYPLSFDIKAQFPVKNHYIDLSSYVNEFTCPLELAILLHDAYHMGIVIYPGFGIVTDVEDKPDAYLLDYVYPLEKSISIKHISSLIFLRSLKENNTKIFLENIKNKIEGLPLGKDVIEFLSNYEEEIDRCYELWHYYKEDISMLYAIWKLKKMLEYSYELTKQGLNKTDSQNVKTLIEKINFYSYEYKDFHDHDLALKLKINIGLIKEFFANVNGLAKNKSEVDVFEPFLFLFANNIQEKLRIATMTYATKKISASQVWENVLTTLKQMESMTSNEILELLPYTLTLFDYPIFSWREKITLLRILQSKRCEQTTEILKIIKKAIMEEIITGSSLSIEVDKLVNNWETGNPLSYFLYKVQEKIEQEEFDPELFERAFNIFCSINALKFFRRNPDRFFEYQYTLDKYVGLQMKKSEKYYFDYFQPLTTAFNEIKKLEKEKVILFIFDGLGFLHSYFASLEISRKESKQLAEFAKRIIDAYKTKSANILSSLVPTLTGVNHLALFFQENILKDDSFPLRITDDSFMPNKGEDKAKVYNILELNEQDRKSAIWRLRLEDSNLQKPSNSWDKVLGNMPKKGILISTNSEKTFLSYLLKANADFKQVDSYTSAIDEAFSDKIHKLVVSQVNLMDTFLHELNTRYPPAFFDDVIKGYWEVYLDLWKTIINRISNGLKKLKRGSVVIITADHGLALGKTSEFKDVTKELEWDKDIICSPKHRITEILSENKTLVGVLIPGHTSRRFLSIFLLGRGIREKEKIRETLERLQQDNKIFFREIKIEEGKRNLTIKPDFLVFPINGMYAPSSKKKYYGGIHGGISMLELFIPFILLEK